MDSSVRALREENINSTVARRRKLTTWDFTKKQSKTFHAVPSLVFYSAAIFGGLKLGQNVWFAPSQLSSWTHWVGRQLYAQQLKRANYLHIQFEMDPTRGAFISDLHFSARGRSPLPYEMPLKNTFLGTRDSVDVSTFQFKTANLNPLFSDWANILQGIIGHRYERPSVQEWLGQSWRQAVWEDLTESAKKRERVPQTENWPQRWLLRKA